MRSPNIVSLTTSTMSPSCCGDCSTDPSNTTKLDIEHPNETTDVKVKSAEVKDACCSDDACGCDGQRLSSNRSHFFYSYTITDTCLEELARAICAEDNEHIHPDSRGNDTASLASGETCKCDEGQSLSENVFICVLTRLFRSHQQS